MSQKVNNGQYTICGAVSVSLQSNVTQSSLKFKCDRRFLKCHKKFRKCDSMIFKYGKCNSSCLSVVRALYYNQTILRLSSGLLLFLAIHKCERNGTITVNANNNG